MTDPPVDVEGMPAEVPESERLARLTGDNARLRAEVRGAVYRAQRAEAEAARVRSSTKYLVGDLLVKAARHPRRLVLLPRDLWRLYRLRRHRRTTTEVIVEDDTAQRRRSDMSDTQAPRLLLPRVTAVPDAPFTILGAVDEVTASAWMGCAGVTSVLPHDAALLAGDTDPDLVIIDTSAALPGGTWSHLGNPAATDRALAAAALLGTARERHRPVVLLRTTPRRHTAGLDALAAQCDLVLDGPGAGPRSIDARGGIAVGTWSPGVDLGMLGWASPLLADRHAAVADLAIIGNGPIARAANRVAEERGLSVTSPAPDAPALAALTRSLSTSHSIVVDLDTGGPEGIAPTALLAALLTGRPLITGRGTGIESLLDESLDDQVISLDATVDTELQMRVSAALDSTLGVGPTDAQRLWSILRRLALHASGPVALADLSARLGLTARPDSSRDLALRSLPGADTATLVEFALTQDLRPREVILGPDASDAALNALAGAAIEVVRLDSPHLPTAAQACVSPTLVTVPGHVVDSRSRHVLLDAVIARETSRLPACTLRSASEDRTPAAALTVLARAMAMAGATDAGPSIDHPGWTR